MAQNFQQFTDAELSEIKSGLRVRIFTLEQQVLYYGLDPDKAQLETCKNALRKIEQGAA